MKVNKRFKQVYHANVPEAWSNDPNGMIYYKGKAHLFFQHYPHKAQWGPMHWGHFITDDFVKWQVLPVALVPDQDYEEICGCCSGSAIEIDGKLWLMYTAAQPELQRQCLAVSEDGIHFTKLAENPILTSDMLKDIVSPRDFRDPKIFKKGDTYYCLAGTRVIDPELYNKRQALITSYQTKDEDEYYRRVKNVTDFNPSRGLPPIPPYNPSHGIVPENPSKLEVLGGSENAVGYGNIVLFKTKNLRDWEYCGILIQRQDNIPDEFYELDGAYECPDYFVSNGKEIILTSPQNLPQIGNKWQNLHSVAYMTGKLNFETGQFEIEDLEDLDSGFDIYASQSLEMPDGRHIMIAWREMWDRTYPTEEDNWIGTYTLPRELEYKDGRLYQYPVREIENYRQNKAEVKNVILENEEKSFEGINGNSAEINVTFNLKDADVVGVKVFKGEVHDTMIYYDKNEGVVYFYRGHSGIRLGGREDDTKVRACDVGKMDKISFRIFIDVISIEVFINGGRYVMTGNVYPDLEDTNISFYSDGTAEIESIEKYDIVVDENNTYTDTF